MAEQGLFNAFWAGFEPLENKPPTLGETPEYVPVVTLAFTGPAEHNTYSTAFLCSKYPAATIQGWVRELQSRGQKVLLSIMDTPDHQWNDVDIPAFVGNAVPVIVDEWGADGVDIDSESGNATPDDFIRLAKEFRKALGPRGAEHAIITYDTFAFSDWDRQILEATKDDYDWVNLMAYFRLYDSMIRLFDQYAQIIAPQLLTIGVKPGRGGFDQATPLPEVKELAAWNPPGAAKKGMMMYNLSIDTPHYTDHPVFTWTRTIHENLR